MEAFILALDEQIFLVYVSGSSTREGKAQWNLEFFRRIIKMHLTGLKF
jgi:hypothetical protein